MSAAPAILARDLCRTYSMGDQQVQALKGVSLTVAQGEFLALMGPSGSGKSTLMNLLGALDTPSAGTLEIAGQPISGLDADQLADLRNRFVGFVFQQFNLLARTSALDNVRLPLLYAADPPADGPARAAEKLAQVGMMDRMDHMPSQLSGGQQQRVAIARALVNNPRLVLADEPTGALDSATGKEIMALFRQLNEAGTTIILVTHEEDIAAWACRQVRLHDGVIIRDEVTG